MSPTGPSGAIRLVGQDFSSSTENGTTIGEMVREGIKRAQDKGGNGPGVAFEVARQTTVATDPGSISTETRACSALIELGGDSFGLVNARV